MLAMGPLGYMHDKDDAQGLPIHSAPDTMLGVFCLSCGPLCTPCLVWDSGAIRIAQQMYCQGWGDDTEI